MSDTTLQDCNCCEIESDCIEGLCQSCSDYNYKLQKQSDLLALGLLQEKDKVRSLEKALEYAKNFIDGYGEARLKENLGRDGMDAVLKEIEKIVNPDEPKMCICCEEITEENAHLHRNCGK